MHHEIFHYFDLAEKSVGELGRMIIIIKFHLQPLDFIEGVAPHSIYYGFIEIAFNAGIDKPEYILDDNYYHEIQNYPERGLLRYIRG
jgi:hypothetical protein